MSNDETYEEFIERIKNEPNNKHRMARYVHRMYENHNQKNSTIKNIIENEQRIIKSNRLFFFTDSIRDIEAKFGGGYASLFEMIRWLFLFNLLTSILFLVFIVIPQIVYDSDQTQDLIDSHFGLNNTSIKNDFCVKKNDTSNIDILTTPFYDYESSNINLNQFADIVNDYQTLRIEKDNNTYNSSVIFALCCKEEYDEYLLKSNQNRNIYDKILDIFQGTGYLEKNFFFYGHYSNKTSTKPSVNKEHSYYMGLSFALVSLFSLLISAITMLFKLGKGARTSIIERMNSKGEIVKFSKIVFCHYDHKITDLKRIEYFQASILSFFKSKLNDIYHKKMMKNLSTFGIVFLYIRRFLVHLLILGLFGVSGYGFFKLNKLSVELKNDEKVFEKFRSIESIVKSLLDYVPAVTIKIINLVFQVLSKILYDRLRIIENHSQGTRTTLLLLRTGFARIGSLLLLIITVAVNVIQNKKECAWQKNELFNSFNKFNISSYGFKEKTDIYCWETYVGQELYKVILLDFLLQFAMLFFDLFKRICCQKNEFDLETKFLDLLNAQNVFWLGCYFSPFLAVVSPFYYFIKFYINKITLLYLTPMNIKNKKKTPNQDEDSDETEMNETNLNSSETRINTSFFIVLFCIFLLISILFGFIFTLLRPSRSCGPFRLQFEEDFRIINEIRNQMNISMPKKLYEIIDFILSTLFLMIIAFIMIIFIWTFFWITKSYKKVETSLTKSLKQDQIKLHKINKRIKELELVLKEKEKEKSFKNNDSESENFF